MARAWLEERGERTAIHRTNGRRGLADRAPCRRRGAWLGTDAGGVRAVRRGPSKLVQAGRAPVDDPDPHPRALDRRKEQDVTTKGQTMWTIEELDKLTIKHGSHLKPNDKVEACAMEAAYLHAGPSVRAGPKSKSWMVGRTPSNACARRSDRSCAGGTTTSRMTRPERAYFRRSCSTSCLEREAMTLRFCAGYGWQSTGTFGPGRPRFFG